MTEHQYPPHVIAAALASDGLPDDARVIIELEHFPGNSQMTRRVAYATVDGYTASAGDLVPWTPEDEYRRSPWPRIVSMFRSAPILADPALHPRRSAFRHVVAFTVDGKPVPKKRARVTKNGNFTPEETTVYQDTIRWHALAAIKRAKRKPGPKDTRVMLALLFKFSGAARPDVDNLIKSVMDALQPPKRGLPPVAYHDDRQVKELRVQIQEHTGTESTTVGVYEILE